MLSLILILFLFWFALSVLMAAGTLFLQGYFNESPPDLAELLWRAPAAAGAVSVFVLVWVIIAYNAPDRFAVAPSDFSSSEETKPVRSLTAVVEGKKVAYHLIKNPRGQGGYFDMPADRCPPGPRKSSSRKKTARKWFSSPSATPRANSRSNAASPCATGTTREDTWRRGIWEGCR